MTARGFDELRVGEATRTGPVIVERADLDRFLDATGERHPLHTDGDVVPAGLVTSRAAGALIAAHGACRVVGLRRMTWQFWRPVRVGVPFWVASEILALTEVDERVGTARIRRRITDADDALLAQGTLDVAVAR